MVSRLGGRSRTLQRVTGNRNRSCGLFGCLGLVFLCLALVVFAAALLGFYYYRTGSLPDLSWLEGALALLV